MNPNLRFRLAWEELETLRQGHDQPSFETREAGQAIGRLGMKIHARRVDDHAVRREVDVATVKERDLATDGVHGSRVT